jgi:uncharacterized protein (DUF1778 family)
MEKKRKRRVNLYLDEDVYYLLATIAAIERKKLNLLATEAIKEYARHRADKLKAALQILEKEAG